MYDKLLFRIDDPQHLSILLDNLYNHYGITVSIEDSDDSTIPQTITMNYANITFHFNATDTLNKSIETMSTMFMMLVTDIDQPIDIDFYMRNMQWIQQVYQMFMNGLTHDEWWFNHIANKFLFSTYEEICYKSMLEVFHSPVIYALIASQDTPHLEKFINIFTEPIDKRFIWNTIEMIISDMESKFQTGEHEIQYKTYVSMDQPFIFHESDLQWLQCFHEYYKS